MVKRWNGRWGYWRWSMASGQHKVNENGSHSRRWIGQSLCYFVLRISFLLFHSFRFFCSCPSCLEALMSLFHFWLKMHNEDDVTLWKGFCNGQSHSSSSDSRCWFGMRIGDDEEAVDGRMIVLCPFWFCNFAYGWFLGFFSQILGHFSHICIVKQFCKA